MSNRRERERERECKSRLSASNGSLVFAVARTQPICLSLQMNALSIYRHWLDWCKVSRIKMKNVWQLLPPAEKPEACRRTWVVPSDLRFVVKSYSLPVVFVICPFLWPGEIFGTSWDGLRIHIHQEAFWKCFAVVKRRCGVAIQAARQPSPLYGATSARGQHDKQHVQDFKFCVIFACQAAESETQAAIIDLEGKFYTDPPYIQARVLEVKLELMVMLWCCVCVRLVQENTKVWPSFDGPKVVGLSGEFSCMESGWLISRF